MNFADLPSRGLSFAHARALWLLIAVAAIFIWSMVGVRAWRQLASRILRALVLALFVLALAGPQQVMRLSGAARPVIVDASNSLTRAMRAWSANLIRNGLKLRSGDPALIFGARPVLKTAGAAGALLGSDAACAKCGPDATDIQAALERFAANPAARGGPAVLITDGWENRGDATRALSALTAAGIRLYIFTPPGAASIPNVAMTELTLPQALSTSAPFALGVTLRNLNAAPVAGTIALYENDRLLEKRGVTLAPGLERFDFPVRAHAVGLVSYRAAFTPANPAVDTYGEDDSLTGWVGIGARRKVLILTGTARDAADLVNVVRRMGLEPAVVTATAKAPFDAAGGLAQYGAILLNNVPAGAVAPPAAAAMVGYVKGGGSLAMVGGDRSFGLGGWQNTALAAAIPVIMKPPEHKRRTRALVLIIDKSGSMGRHDKLLYAKAAARTVLKTLRPTDLISVIGFDSQPFVIVPLETVAQARPYFDQMVDRLRAGGTTYLMPALQQADRTLAQSGAAIKHTVILTDGETGGSAEMYYDLVSSMHRDGGVTVSAIAVGNKANLGLLQAIATYGGGGFYQTDSASNLPTLFLQDFKQHGGEVTLVEKDLRPIAPAPDPVLGDLAGREFPKLKGYVRTVLKPRAHLNMFVSNGEQRAPLVASWDFGKGRVMAVTTDASGRWSGLWVKQHVFGKVWDKLLNWMAPKSAAEQAFDVALGYRDGRIRMKLTDYGPTGSTMHVAQATVTRPDGSRVPAMLSEDVPGELTGSIDAPRPGTYYIEVKSEGSGATRFPPLAFTVSPAVLAEVPRAEPNYDLLERLASATGGRLNPLLSDLALTRPTTVRRVALDQWLIVAAMVLLIIEAVLRRLLT